MTKLTTEQRREIAAASLAFITAAKASSDPAVRKQAEEFEPAFTTLIEDLDPRLDPFLQRVELWRARRDALDAEAE